MSSEAGGGTRADEAAVGVPWRSKAFYVILATSLVIPLDVPYVGPVQPAVRAAFDVTAAQAGLVITVFAGPGIVATVVFGVLADRVGRRRVLVPCLALYGGFGVLVAFAGEFRHVLALRFLQGVFGGGVLATLALTLVGDFYDGARRNTVMGVTTGVTALGAAVYPTVGGALAAVAWDLPFLLYGLAVVAAAVAFLLLEEPDVDRSGRGESLDHLRRSATALPATAGLALYGAALASAVIVFGGVVTGVAFLLDATYGLGTGGVGLVLTVPLLVAAVVSLGNGWLSERLGQVQLLAVGFLGYGLGLVGTWLAATPVEVAMALVVVGGGHGLVLPTVPAALSRLAPARFRGGVLSLRTSLLLVGQTVGPLLFTVPAAAVGYAVPLMVAGVAAGLAGAVALLVAGRG